jgi:uncharacterized protein YjbI with pentapeptide repeats
MNREETWQRLVDLGCVEGEMPNSRWNLNDVDLSGVNLKYSDLSGADLHQANMKGIDLTGANVSDAHLNMAILENAHLTDTNLSNAILMHASLSSAGLLGTNLSKAYLYEANLAQITSNSANFVEADLRKANLYSSDFYGTNFSHANLSNATMVEANLVNSNFSGANLSNANIKSANLRGADLSNADLSNADLTGCIMIETNLNGANLTNSYVYGISTWDLKINNNTTMKDLVIYKHNQHTLKTDNIELAQFIYMLLNNAKNKSIIDTMKTKIVLLLGSFDQESMVVIEAIKSEIRNRGFLPLLFSFEGPESQELMETVRTMALLSHFVIIDLSIPAGQLHELARMVSHTFVPFVTVARQGTKITAMHGELRHYYWYRMEYFAYSYDNIKEDIPDLFYNKILP